MENSVQKLIVEYLIIKNQMGNGLGIYQFMKNGE